MALDPKLWWEYKPCHYQYIGPDKEPNIERVKEMIRDAVSKSKAVGSNAK